MALIDIPDYEVALFEAFRVLKKGGFFQFSITHLCFWTPDLHWINDAKGEKYALACRNYFDGSDSVINEWVFEGVGYEIVKEKGVFKTPLFKRTLSNWINTLIETGFL